MEVYMFGLNPILKQERGDSLAIQSIFHTIQGEGPFSGKPAVFIRYAGCNLKCTFCDTDFMSNIKNRMSASEVSKTVEDILFDFPNTKLVVITGGEPFRQELGPLISLLQKQSLIVQIETAGTLWDETLQQVDMDQLHIVCSPKTATLNPTLVEHCRHYKYIIQHGKTCPSTGIPIASTQKKDGPNKRLAVVNRKDVTIWVQACDDYNPELNKLNLAHTAYIAMKYGYNLSYQIHKALGLE